VFPHPHTIFSLLGGLFIVFSAIAPALSARAQTADSAATITAVDTGAFPEMSVYLAVSDAAGNHVRGLPASAFALTEDQSPISNLAISESEVGTQGVIVLDTSAAFKARDANAVTRLDFVKQALTGDTRWMKDGVDDVTVIAPEAVLIAHSRAVSDVVGAVTSYASEFAGIANHIPFANQALDFAADATPHPGMRRYMVFISNGFTGAEDETALADLVARANTSRIPIHTIFVGPAGDENTASAQRLKKLAEATGGMFVIFDRPASLDSIFQRLADERTQYLLSYRSTLAVTGQHSLFARVTLPGGAVLTSEVSAFPLRIEPPVIAIQNAPAAIQRVSQQPGADPQTIEPTTYAVQFAADFPDGHPRALNEVQLLVDGEVADTQRIAPIESLNWPLAGYAASGAHTLQLRATDELGLVAESEVLTVTVTVAIPQVAAAQRAAGVPVEVVGLAGLIAAAGLAVIVWLWLRRRPPPAPAQAAASRQTQPLTPISRRRATPRLPLPLPQIHLPARRAAQPKRFGKAYLEVVEPGAGGGSRNDIELFGETVRLGREPSLAQIVFPDRSVSRLHARIEETPPGVFQIFDERSTSGTWVNFNQIPAGAGCELKPGDLINLGRVQLRFQRRDRSAPAAPSGESSAPPQPSADGTGPTEPYRPRKDG
jgi:pSer/pThr/pTyr-binding forkhead associated (FHA) protein